MIPNNKIKYYKEIEVFLMQTKKPFILQENNDMWKIGNQFEYNSDTVLFTLICPPYLDFSKDFLHSENFNIVQVNFNQRAILVSIPVEKLERPTQVLKVEMTSQSILYQFQIQNFWKSNLEIEHNNAIEISYDFMVGLIKGLTHKASENILYQLTLESFILKINKLLNIDKANCSYIKFEIEFSNNDLSIELISSYGVGGYMNEIYNTSLNDKISHPF